MKSVVRVKEPNGAWRQLSVGEAVAEASHHLSQGDDESALNLLEKAVAHAPGVPVARYLLGVAQVRQKLYEPAISNLERVVRSDERNVDYLAALGEALAMERPLDAIPHLARAVELGSKKPEAFSKLASLLVDTRKPEDALHICGLGLAACGVHPRILGSRGLALRALARCEEALACLRQGEALLPQDHTTMTDLASVLLDLGRVPEARSYLERACALDPDSPSAHYNLGLVLLLEGNYREGFREYEGRWGIQQLVGRRKTFPRPAWDGSELEGRRVLLHAEQGAGDAIQFVRYADFVRARGGRVILLAPAPLSRLLSWLADCEIAALDLPLPPFDVHCPLLSLPRLAATDKDSIPPPAQFAVPSQMKHKWSAMLGEKTGIRVGLVWAGAPAHRNDRNRSFACRLFAPLLEIPQVQWFSLQVGPAAAQLAEPGIQGKIRDLAPELTDYAETAAAISQLDLVITADTSVAHLAGSLGTPVWMLTPFAPDWRWLLERDDSPWYPGMRLFRQRAAGDWASVMDYVAADLRQLLPAEPAGALRHLSVGEAVVEATRHLEQGEPESALKLLEKVVRDAPGVPVFHYLLGVAQSRQMLSEPAISNFEVAALGEENNIDFLVALCGALMAERPLDAIAHLTRAAHLGPKHAQAYSRLAELLIDAQKPDDALRICDSGLATCGVNPGIMRSRGRALWAVARYEEGLECLREVEALLPQDPATMLGLGSVLLGLGRVTESRSYMERACALDPGNAEAHFSFGVVLLLEGNYRDGFREYEGRWGVQKLAGRRKTFPRPAWDGSELEGRRVLLHAEQGAGDAIQFVRYADFVRARGGRVILLAPAPLSRLLSWLGDCEIAALDLPLPPFDVHCPLLSLPRLAATDKDSIPPPAQFAVPSQMKQKWSAMLGEKTGMRVGLVWAGAPAHRNDRNRSFACRLFAPLLEIPQVQWFSLQAGPAAAQLAEPGIQGKIRDLAPELTDYAETAAAISQLDLVITADTSVAHLAGSLGTPVWMLTPFAPDWRWLLERNDSPWYPGMRLFRQQAAGDWASVMDSVAAAIRHLLRAAPAGAPAVRSAPGPNASHPDPARNERACLAADFIPAGATVLDLGCGPVALEGYLPPGCRYMPCDTCDFNEQPIPRPADVTHITALGMLEHIHDWRGFLQQLRAFERPVVLSYGPTDFTSHPDREAVGRVNHLTSHDLCGGFAEAGFHIQSSLRLDGTQVLVRIVPAETRLPVRRRVLVMSSHNSGDFGDRLGFHTINSLMPAGAEVHHGHLEPWDVPPGHFDLLVLGTGNSIFHPFLTDKLMELTRRISRSVGIFGTRYRDGIDRRRMSQLLDRLTVWFARSEEDLLLYGAGRQNAMHLGAWLIGAMPMTRWSVDETLHVGPGIRNGDLTIQGIQKYRGVVSEQIHPLLCALTSAERVAYREQRDGGSGKHSGEFRSLLIDIFGRTWPESDLFEFPRDAVSAYRARTMRVMSGMPQLFNQLLELD